MKIPPVNRVHWKACWRAIPTRYAEERVLLKISDPEDAAVIAELDEMTNQRLRHERGEVSSIAPEDRVSGEGSQYIMAAFAYKNPVGSRFSDGSYGVYYTAKEQPTAIAEAKYHTELFMQRTKEAPMRLERRMFRASLAGDLHDIRGKTLPGIYDKTSYISSQNFGQDFCQNYCLLLLKEDCGSARLWFQN